jgi:hypothetical protein
MCHARYLARKAIKAQLQAAGYKVSHVDARIINVKADAYLDQYRDALIAQATMTIDSVPGLRKLAEQEAQRRAKAIQKTSLQQRAKSSTVTGIPRALPTHTAIDRLSNRHST